MSPNPTVISQSKEPEEDRSLWKIIILALFGAGLVIVATHFFNEFLLTAGYSNLFFSFLFVGIFLVVMILQVFFIKDGFKMAGVTFLQGGVAPLIVFYPKIYPAPSLVLIAGSLIFFIFMVSAAIKGQRVLANSLEVRFFFTARNILPRVFTGFLIFFTIVLYLNYFLWDNFNDELGKVLVGQTLDSSRPIVGIVFSDISFNKTVQNFLDVIAENQLRKIRPGLASRAGTEPAIDFQSLSPPEKAEVVKQFSLGLKKELEKIVGPLNVNEPVKGEVFKIVKNYFSGLSDALKSALGLVLALVFFFSIKGMASLLYWFIELVAFVLFKFLLITGFARISLENRGREFVILS